MIVRRRFTLVLTIAITLWAHPGSTEGERWSRQVLNSEWIPLANPRSLQGGGSLPGIVPNPEAGNPGQLQPLALPQALRDQYHQQLLQLQETQESIQKLLQLQQQLRAQQQLLQAQSYLPEGFSNEEERKAALHQSTIANIQTLPHLAPGALLPPPPGDQPQPPEFAAQDFLAENPQKFSQDGQGSQDKTASYNVNNEEETKRDKNEENISPDNQAKTKDYITRQGGHYKNSKQLRDNPNGEQFVPQATPGSLGVQNDGEEEVQLLYVPAETLAQRDQQQKTQRVRNRKQHVSQQQQVQQQQPELSRQQTRYQQQPNAQRSSEFQSQGLEGTRPSVAQQTFAHQVLYQLQEEQAKRTRLQQEERDKEVARLREEQIELERQAKLHQERVFREQDARRRKELALRKELERQEEEARQKELQRLKEEKQRKLQEEESARKKEVEKQEELERQKIAEILAQEREQKETEIRQAEIDRLAALERQKEIEIQQSLKQQEELERQQAEDEARARAQIEAQRQAQANSQLEAHRLAHQDAIDKQRQAQIDAAKLDAQNRAQNQAQQQHLTETTRPKSLRLKGRSRQRNRQESQPTTPSPNQPPLSVYMGSTSPVVNPDELRVSDVLTILKDAKTISVLDSVGPDAPLVFVGPTNLAPPNGYAKFDLPYLSTIDNNRVERKVDKLPFFVAPLSFKPPPGYSKIPFPAPHIGSVVINNLDDEPDPLDGPPGGVLKTDEELRPSPEPLIEPNSYIDGAQFPTRNPYVQQVTPQFSQEAFVATTTPRYEASYSTTPSSGTRYRHRQFYNDRSPHVVSTAVYEDHSSTEPGVLTRNQFRQFHREEQGHGTSSYNNAPTPSPQTNYQENIELQDNLQPNFSTVNGEQELSQHVSDQELVRNPFHDVNHGVDDGLYHPGEAQGLRSNFGGNQNTENHGVGQLEDSRVSPGPTQYTIGSELPRISPQLPGLVNSLFEQQELREKTAEPSTTPSTTTTTTTTTTEPPTTTTYRTRGRQRGRVVPTRTPTTTEYAPTNTPVNDRSRRPYSRSRVRQGYATTTETHQETIHEPTKKFSGVVEKTHYSTSAETQRRPATRNQRYRGRVSDKNAVKPEARPDAGVSGLDQNPQNQEGNYGNNPQRHSLLEPNAPSKLPKVPVYREEGFLSSVTPDQNNDDSLRPNAQPLQGAVTEAAINQEGIQEIQGISYQPGFKASNFGQTNVEQTPVNGFNYQSQKEGYQSATEAPISPQQYPGDSFNGQRPQNAEQIYSFHGFQPGDSPEKPNINNFQNADLNRDSIYASSPSGNRHSLTDSDNVNLSSPDHREVQDPPAGPLFDLLDEKNEFSQASSTTTEAPETTTPRPNLTPGSLIVRQRVRARLNQNTQRPHVDAAIQTRPTGSRDEFVRFSAVNQDVRHTLPGRNYPGTRQRPRNRGQVNQGKEANQANVQTEGNDYVRIQTPLLRSTTTTTTTTIQPPSNYGKETNDDIEYGFIRPPSFKPIHPVPERPIANVVPTYRPKYEQVQTEEPTNDAPVEVNTPQTSTLKNRQKYHVMNRRPLTRSTTAAPLITTTTTTEAPIQAEVYTIRPKVRNEEYKGSRTRGRVRRPGNRRTTTTSTTTTTTTTTTESILDSSNELPLDENYPRIIHGVQAPPNEQLQTLFDEELKSANLETLPQPVALQRPVQTHSFQHQENSQFPRQDFVLNFGIGSEDEVAHEEYDQTQLASSPQRKYGQINRGNLQSRPGSIPVADIEGAESQWSTKLTHSSFQPSSLLNQVQNGETKNKERQEKSEDSFDIITAAPDLASDDLSVTANNSNAPRDIIVNASYLGNAKKGGFGIAVTPEKPVLQGRLIVEDKTESFKEDSSALDSLQFWNTGEIMKNVQENFDGVKILTKNETDDPTTTPNIFQDVFNPTTDATKTVEITEEPPTTKRTANRRRRLRIRVRPTDDFVSAESQHVSSAWNSLVREKEDYDKTGRFQDFRSTTIPSIFSTTEATTVRSFFEELLDEMTKNNEMEVPVDATSTTTNAPDVTETTTNGLSRISKETETPGTTTTTQTGFTSLDLSTTTRDLQTTMNEKFATEATTENRHLSTKSHEKKTSPLEKIEKPKPTESLLEHHRFHPKDPHKIWWNHNYDSLSEAPKPETIVPKFVTDLPESTSEATTMMTTDNKDSTSGHSLSDYVDAFFKTMEGDGNSEEDRVKEMATTTELISPLSGSKMEEETTTTLKTVPEEQKNNVSGLVQSTTVYNADDGVVEETKEMKIEDVTTLKKVEEVTTTTGQDTTENLGPITTSEIPLSPEELTTEIPATTTTISTADKQNLSSNNLAKVLRTSTTTEISHMTEICYRGRCVKTKSRKEVRRR